MQRLLIILGLLIAAAGVLWPWLSKLPTGRLPGDVVVDRPGFKLFAPFTTMIIVSVVVSVIVWLLNRFQGGGLGKPLMSHAIERARAEGAPRLLLGVYSENAGAIAFYRRLGFETIGHRPFTVGTMVCDDFIMSLVL